MADPRRRPRLVAVVPGGVVVAHGTLDPMTQVRILAGQLPSPTEPAISPLCVSEQSVHECLGLSVDVWYHPRRTWYLDVVLKEVAGWRSSQRSR